MICKPLTYPLNPEVNNDMSMTIPDMSYSLAELIRKARIGTLPADLVRNVLYDESDDFDSVLAENIAGYDLVDKDRELEKLRAKFEAMHKASGSGRSGLRSTAARDDSVESEANTTEESSQP